MHLFDISTPPQSTVGASGSPSATSQAKSNSPTRRLSVKTGPTPRRDVTSSVAKIVSANLGISTVEGQGNQMDRDLRLGRGLLAPLSVSEDYLSAFGVHPAKMVLLKNRPVLWQVFIFYSFHAATIKYTRTSGKGNVVSAVSPIMPLTPAVLSTLASAETRYDKKLLGRHDFEQLLRDFRLLAADAPGVTWLETFLDHPDAHGGRLNAMAAATGTMAGFGEPVSFETKLSFREFLRCLLKVGEERFSGEVTGLAETLLRVLETMVRLPFFFPCFHPIHAFIP